MMRLSPPGRPILGGDTERHLKRACGDTSSPSRCPGSCSWSQVASTFGDLEDELARDSTSLAGRKAEPVWLLPPIGHCVGDERVPALWEHVEGVLASGSLETTWPVAIVWCSRGAPSTPHAVQ